MNKDKHNITVAIEQKTILYTISLLVLLYILWQISGIVIGLFISVLIMVALNPIVLWLQAHKIPRGVSSIVLLFLMFIAIISVVSVLIPPAVTQAEILFSGLPAVLEKFGIQNGDFSFLSSQIGSMPGNAVKIVSAVFDNALAMFATLILSFYLLQERPKLAKLLKFLFHGNEGSAETLLAHMETKLGGWIRGELVLCTIVGLMVYAGLSALNIPYALPLAIIGGLLEIVPNIGPTISMVPSAIVGFAISPLHGVGIVALYIVIQQLENNFIVPQIMKTVVGIHPLTTLISLMVGYKLGGPFGAMLAIPFVLAWQVAFPIFFAEYKKRN